MRRAEGVPKSRKKCYHAIRDGFPQLSREPLFFRSDPQVVRNGDLVVFWLVLGRRHLSNFGDWAKKEKRNFPAPGVLKWRRKSCHAIRHGGPQPFYILRFARPDRQGWEIAKYGYFGRFWPGMALGTEINPGRGLKTEKCNFQALGVPKSRKKLPHYPGWLFATFLRCTFWPTGPPRAGNRKMWGF